MTSQVKIAAGHFSPVGSFASRSGLGVYDCELDQSAEDKEEVDNHVDVAQLQVCDRGEPEKKNGIIGTMLGGLRSKIQKPLCDEFLVQ